MAHKTALLRVLVLFVLASIAASAAQPSPAQADRLPGGGAAFQPAPTEPQVRYADHQDQSLPLREIRAPRVSESGAAQSLPRFTFPKVENSQPGAPGKADPLAQEQSALLPQAALMPAPLFNFEGINNLNSVVPPDTNGDVGPNHYVQWVNLSLAIWQIDRATNTATLIYGPVNGNALWAGFGGKCETSNHGDPIVLYDHLADRWLVSQFSVDGPYYECIAISQTGDPTGAWHRYAFEISATKMNDYPHLGVWPDGYYMTVNQFIGQDWAGAGVVVFEREKMLAGLPARQVYFDLESVDNRYGGMLPSDLDGPPPPDGTPNYFGEVDDGTWIGPSDAFRIWEFYVDWTNPANSTFGLGGHPNVVLPVASFTPLCIFTSSCIPQLGTLQRLDAIGDRLMHRLQYRYFGTHASLLTNHTVDAGGSRAGVRWYELRRTGGTWSVFQQGTYTGPDSNSEHRWMGSAAMDKAGNIAIGYSASGSSIYPAIRYAGRLASDPTGLLAQGEATLTAGGGSQTTYTRWGDYSMLSVDPSDDCTFWFTSEYYPVSSAIYWHTRVGSFRLENCLADQTGTLQGSVTRGDTGQPLEGAQIAAGEYTTQTDASGFYRFSDLPTGTYTVSASAYGFMQAEAPGVVVSASATTTQNFTLDPVSPVPVSGTVRDGSGQGWPLYARLQISATGGAWTVFTNPVTGAYQINLAPDIPHTFTVSPVVGSYQSQTTVFTPTVGAATLDFNLQLDPSCQAPGYSAESGCQAVPGSLVIGNVSDANTGLPVNGATIANQGNPSEATSAFATPEDPNVADGFYILFSALNGTGNFSARSGQYGTQIKSLTLTPGGLVHQDFQLPAGRLQTDANSLALALTSLQKNRYVLTLTNSGTYPAAFSLTGVNAPSAYPEATGPFAPPVRHVSPKRLHDLTAAGVFAYNPPNASPFSGGQTGRSWLPELASVWGIGFNSNSGDLWLGSTSTAGGEDRNYQYLRSGQPTGASVDLASIDPVFPADMAFDPYSGTFWQVMVGGENCLVEMDPDEGRLTGRQICPAFDNPQRGLAFNPLDRTFYSGSWVNGILYHFDSTGRILDSVNTGLNISGLAYNPATRHLFVLSNANQGYDVYVLDTEDQGAILGGFDITGLEAYQQAGLEIDCDGYLWAVNQATRTVYQASSGEGPTCTWSEIPWLTVSPISGTLPAQGEQEITLDVQANTSVADIRKAHLVVANDTPYGPLTIELVPSPSYAVLLPMVSR